MKSRWRQSSRAVVRGLPLGVPGLRTTPVVAEGVAHRRVGFALGIVMRARRQDLEFDDLVSIRALRTTRKTTSAQAQLAASL